MTPENTVSAVAQPSELTPENAKLLTEYADHLQRTPLTGRARAPTSARSGRTSPGSSRGEADGDPLNDAAAKDWAVRDYRSYLVTTAKRATATVNKHLAALQDFYVWRGLGEPQGVKRHQAAGAGTEGAGAAKAKLRRPAGRWGAGEAQRDGGMRRRCRRIGGATAFDAEVGALDVGDVEPTAPARASCISSARARSPPPCPSTRNCGLEALAAWLAERPAHRGAESAALFVSGRGTRMTS